MYLANNNYNMCNYLKGIPLWDKMQNNIPSQTISKSCQINYPFLKPIFSKQIRQSNNKTYYFKAFRFTNDQKLFLCKVLLAFKVHLFFNGYT